MTTSTRLESWFRLGYAARGVVWISLGVAAIVTRRGQSTHSVIEDTGGLALGSLLLIVLAVALVGLGCFRLAEAWLDLDRRGDGIGGRLQRIARAAGGLGYFVLAAAAVAIALDGESLIPRPSSAARDVRSYSGGGLLLILLSLGMLVVAGAQAWQAWQAVSARFRHTLELATPKLLIWLGRAGYLARAIIFMLIGWHLLRAGLAGHRVRDVGAVLGGLKQHFVFFNLLSFGLLLFGLYSLAEARYRRIDGCEVERRSRNMLKK